MSSNNISLIEVINALGSDPSDSQFKDFLVLFAQKLENKGTEDELIEGFKKLDIDGNGLLSASRIRSSFEGIISDEKIDQLIKNADIDGDGYINYYEYVSILTKS